MNLGAPRRLKLAVIGGGMGGLSAAWLLSQAHDVTVFEADARLGGHANTVEARGHGDPIQVDTGFIVYNEANYPNFTALLAYLEVPHINADMSLSVSLDDGAFEYSSFGPLGVFAQKRNLFSARFWGMLRDISRFYRNGEKDLAMLRTPQVSLDTYLRENGYCQAFRDDHLLPQAAAIWSTPVGEIGAYPAASLIRFFLNHGMMSLVGRGLWRTVAGGSQTYVKALTAQFRGSVRLGAPVQGVRRDPDGIEVRLADGGRESFDQVVIATHADTALSLLDAPTSEETRRLSAFRYSRNLAVLHTDAALMPKRRRAWCSWNHIGRRDTPGAGCVTYWMNRLQSLPKAPNLFVTLNPTKPVAAEHLIRTDVYDHPLFDGAAVAAQAELWGLQGVRRTWFCGSYFGHGFHEDALQSGLAVAEQLGGVRRPWTVADESGRIHVGVPAPEQAAA